MQWIFVEYLNCMIFVNMDEAKFFYDLRSWAWSSEIAQFVKHLKRTYSLKHEAPLPNKC